MSLIFSVTWNVVGSRLNARLPLSWTVLEAPAAFSLQWTVLPAAAVELFSQDVQRISRRVEQTA